MTSTTTKSLTAAQVKRRIGTGMLVLADVEGTVWASNRYWLTRAESLDPFLREHSISGPGTYWIENGSVERTGTEVPDLGKFMDLAQYTVPLRPVQLGGHDEIYAPGREGYFQLFEHADKVETVIVAVPADQLDWLEDVATLNPERIYSMRLATTERVPGPVVIIADPLGPEPGDETAGPETAVPELVAVLMPSVPQVPDPDEPEFS